MTIGSCRRPQSQSNSWTEAGSGEWASEMDGGATVRVRGGQNTPEGRHSRCKNNRWQSCSSTVSLVAQCPCRPHHITLPGEWAMSRAAVAPCQTERL
jgi:hypothetical protein